MKHRHKWAIAGLASFLLPISIMFTVLLSMGISYQGERTILASDAFHQYVIFAQNLRNILHGSDSLFYTFTSGLGLNFYALISYYLGSFFSPLYFFFDLASMPDAIYLLTLLKFGFMGLTACYAFHKLYPNIKAYLIVSLSLSYSLMSFLTSQLELNSWLDVFILLPLILLGLNQIILKKKTGLYYVCVSLLFIQNYYFGYMVAIFSSLYAFVCLLKLNNFKKGLVAFLRFTTVSIMAALTSAVMLLPTYLDLSSYGETFSPVKQLITTNAWYFDLPAKLSLGAYDTTKFNALPMIYVGLFPLLLAVIFFTLSSVPLKIKSAYATLLVTIVSSFYLQPLDLFWQGMHAPNMFLHRYAWTFPVTLLLLACEALTRQIEFSKIKISIAFIFLVLILATPYLTAHRYDFLTPSFFLLSLAFLVAYTICLLAFQSRQIPVGFLLSFTLFFTILEASLNTYYQTQGINNEWVFPTRQGYQNQLSGQSLTYFHLQPSQLISGAKQFNQQVSGQSKSLQQSTVITYQVTIPERSQLYVSIPNIIFSNPNAKEVRVSIDGNSFTYTTDNAYSFFDLGYFEHAKEANLSFIFPKNKQISFTTPHFYSLSIDSYLKAITAINQKEVHVYTSNNNVITNYNAKEDGSLIFTIPYDKGWSATKNGKPIPITKAQGGFLTVSILKGKGQVILTFIPNGFKLGLMLSLFGIISYLFLVYYQVTSQKKKRQVTNEKVHYP